jgi:predicted nucleic acid-binding protein
VDYCGLDTNVLIYAQMPAFETHELVRRNLLSHLQQPDVTLVVTPMILHEFVHVITDSRRFDPPVPMREALAAARLFLGHANVMCLAVSEESTLRAFDLLGRYRLGRKRIADTLFVATLFQHGVSELITCNPKDFTVFPGLAVTDPRAS